MKAITHDNASNITNAVKSLITMGAQPRRCFAHIVNLACQRGLSSIKPIIIKLRKTVRWINKSPQAQEALEEAIGFHYKDAKRPKPKKWRIWGGWKIHQTSPKWQAKA